MRRLISVILFIFISTTLFSCGKIERNIDFQRESWGSLNIEIYYLEESYATQGEAVNIRDENNPICVITDYDVIDAFMKDISSLTFIQEVVYFPAPVDWVYIYEGYVVCVVYPDGYDIIAEKGQLYYNVDHKGNESYKYGHSDYSGETPWSEIVEKYVLDE